jgi:hypothetical protein
MSDNANGYFGLCPIRHKLHRCTRAGSRLQRRTAGKVGHRPEGRGRPNEQLAEST